MLRCLFATVLFVAACDSRNTVPYGACQTSSVCAEVTPRCVKFRNRVDGREVPLCTASCTTNTDCPENGICVDTETVTLGSLCVQRCSDPDACRFANAICPMVRPNEGGCLP